MNLDQALSALGQSVRDREVEIGKEIWTALDAAGLGRYARLAAGVDEQLALPAPEVTHRKPSKKSAPPAKPKPKPPLEFAAAVTLVKKQIRMGGAKTAFIETLAEDGPQSSSTVLPTTLNGMVEAGVVKVDAQGMVSFTPLGVAWAATYKIKAAEVSA